MSDWLVFLHLSDIHFNKHKVGPEFDLDGHLRSKLIADVRRFQPDLGSLSAVLVTGDIAWSGKKEEFDIAVAWMEGELSETLQCALSDFRVVPGNHDIDRKVVKDRPSLQDARGKFRDEDHNSHALDKLIERYMVEPDTFYAPLDEYNRFAATFDCDISVKRPRWSEDFKFNDGSVLRAVGLNSTLISDENDHRRRAQLILGRHQTQLLEEPGVEYMTLAHHPPSWLLDGEDVQPEITAQTRLQLWGHKHKFRLKRDGERSLILAAGAVHPSRSEDEWLPYFSWIAVRVEQREDERALVIRVFPRRWNQSDQSFDCDRNECDENKNYKEEVFKLSPFTATSPPTAVTDKNKMSNKDAARLLASRFFRLQYTQKMKIADTLSLHQDGDGKLNEIERYKAFLKRILDRNEENKAWELVEAAHSDGRYSENPFKG